MSAEIIGITQLLRDLETIRTVVPRNLARELYDEAESIMADSKQNYVPVDLGVLRSTGFVDLPRINGTSIEIVMGYGGPSAPYAVVQHENMELNHQTGGPKYLERPVLKAAPNIIPNVAKRLRVKP